MNKNKIRDFHFHNYIVQHKEKKGSKCIFFCANENKEYREAVSEGIEKTENEDLLWHNRILFVETESGEKNKKKRYEIFYRETEKTTVILADSIKIYRSCYFIREAGRYAAEEWNRRHICLPSLMTAILLLETEGGKHSLAEVEKSVKEHTELLAVRKAMGMTQENWKSLWGEDNYILAVQYLQGAAQPYFKKKEYEELLVRIIEENRLTRFDFSAGC